jgi:hypothetical protein
MLAQLRRLALLFAAPLALGAQDAPLTTDVLDRFVTAYDKEREDIAALDPQLRAIDEKIQRFRECKLAFEAAGSATRSRLGGLAARAGIRARCGANSEADIEKEKDALREAATAGAARAGGFTVPQFSRLRTRLERIYGYGDRAGLTPPELEAVTARAERFSSIYGNGQAVADALAGLGGAASGGAAGARPMPGQWTADISWMYIGQMFGMMYATGANVFDGEYEPGEWTIWSMGGSDDKDNTTTVERAYLARTEDGGQWWRYKTITATDTIVLEGLFRPAGEGMQQLVRMRGKMPGDREANELMVPQHMMTLSTLGMFGSRPTKESVDGATIGTESVTTPSGNFTAKRVRFGGAGGRQEWWLTEQVPGGWVKYQVTPTDGDESFIMQLVRHGTGARSELGVPQP